MQLLKSSMFSRVSFSLGLDINLASSSLASFLVANLLSARSSISSVYILTSPNASFVIVISRHKSYVNIVIESFSL